MEEEGIVLERHEQRITVLKREIRELRLVRDEIRAMNESLVMLPSRAEAALWLWEPLAKA